MRWVTYFPKFTRVHLTKDVGLIPYYAHLAGFDASLVGHADERFELPEEAAGLHLDILEDQGQRFFLDRAFLKWLSQNAKSVDILHLFHLARDTIFYGAYFKNLNPGGKVYLKMDAYNDHLLQRKRYAKGDLKNFVIGKVEERFLRNLDLASIENRDGLNLAKKTYPELRHKLFYLPNGCNDDFLLNRFPDLPEKEKLILSVGRPGSPDKNYELLLRALPMMKFDGWRMEIVGPETQDFATARRTLIEAHPELAEKVVFSGFEGDRNQLYEKFLKASVFFLPSRLESFGISFVEALFFGSVLVGHKGMYAYSDICNEGEFGTFFENDDAESFVRAIEEAKQLSTQSDFRRRAARFGRERFAWSKLIRELLAKLGHD